MKRLGGAAAAAAVVLMLTACGGSPEPAPTITVTETVTATPAPAPTVTVTVPPVASPPLEPEGDVALSDEARRDVFLLTLTQIDPGLTVNAERALRRADNTCLDIEQGKDEANLIANTEARFEGGDVPDLTADQALQIVNAARDYHC